MTTQKGGHFVYGGDVRDENVVRPSNDGQTKMGKGSVAKRRSISKNRAKKNLSWNSTR